MTKNNVTVTMDIAAQYHVNQSWGQIPQESGAGQAERFDCTFRSIEIPFVTATSKNDQQAIDQILAAMCKDSFIEDWLTYKNAEDELIDYKENYARCS